MSRRSPSRGRMDVGRITVYVSIGVIVIEAIWVISVLMGFRPDLLVALDYRIYGEAASRWLARGGFYLPGQLAGPYQIEIGDVLYPPVILWLLVPFVVLPPFLWWAIPVGLTMYSVWQVRPAVWAWPLIVALCLWPRLPQIVIHGNPTMWVMAFAALAVVHGWSGPLVLIKPVLAPFALIGIRRRVWWVGLGAFLLLCLPFGDLWLQWVQVTLDSGGATYALGDYQPMLLPVVLWAASTRRPLDSTTGPLEDQSPTVLGRMLARALNAGQ